MAGLVPAIHVLGSTPTKTWMPATSAGMTTQQKFIPLWPRVMRLQRVGWERARHPTSSRSQVLLPRNRVATPSCATKTTKESRRARSARRGRHLPGSSPAPMLPVTLPKNGRFEPTKSAPTIANASSTRPISVKPPIQALTFPNASMCTFSPFVR